MNEDFRFLTDLFNAINSIDDEYCNWTYFHETIQKTERVFAYELYYALKVIARNERVQYNGIKFNGEIGKKMLEDINQLGTNFIVEQKNFNPDLVLHKGQIDKDSENQKLIIEIKTINTTDEKIAKDIIKLNYGIAYLNFQFGVFISVNTDFRTLNDKLKRIFQVGNIPVDQYFQ
ncbi:hypothetical protein NAL32_17470 [Chryseobacterium sp. Ch-15]|uniref:Uncharacterized protein n=1 Tax=Chryseobacterium muglaense TaxID=2893752 RepID=A0A9Q3YXI2_9FLAO|nr:hypothetical protein [Chryseobacterium muglaense]MBD3906438.1 hypothetical protein [Chryseobacterium muglaense]MCC9036850.1 hypothetical protein [Chryseobacterium muglaense]MCM2556176.1 hypothetical protein [Chryseobacterium muglaense]